MAKAPTLDSGVVYLNHSTKHVLRLLVSITSLREHYDGPILVLDTGIGGEPIKKIDGEKLLNVAVKAIETKQLRRHTAYVTKASLWRHSPFDCTLYLDADTLVAGPMDFLLNLTASEKSGFVATRFADWITTGRMISGRLRRWQNVKCPGIDVQSLLLQSLEYPHAHVNTGVFAWRRGAKILKPWERLTQAGWNAPFTDEYSCQLLLREYPHTLVDDRWNCSPLYGTHKDKARIWHFHGSKHVSRANGKFIQSHNLWWPKFLAVWHSNLAGVRDWVPAGDPRIGPHLDELKKETAA